MIYTTARLLQLAGLVILPLAVMGNIADPHNVTLKDSLMMAALGGGLFFLGWMLQKTAKK